MTADSGDRDTASVRGVRGSRPTTDDARAMRETVGGGTGSRLGRAAASSRRLIAASPQPCHAARHSTRARLGSGPCRAVSDRNPARPPAQLGRNRPAADGSTGDADPQTTPILLLHGLVDNRSVFTRLRTSLAREGFGCLLSLNYPVLTGDIRPPPTTSPTWSSASVIAPARVGCTSSGTRWVGSSRATTCSCWQAISACTPSSRSATPHHGTATARLVPYGIVRQLRPGSDGGDAAGRARRAVPNPHRVHLQRSRCAGAARSLPTSSTRISDVRNVLVPGAGHHTLPFDRRTVRGDQRNAASPRCRRKGSSPSVRGRQLRVIERTHNSGLMLAFLRGL